MKKNQIMSSELKDKISKANRHKHNMTLEGSLAISKSRLGVPPNNKNKICINNGVKNKYIYSSDLDYYLKCGWIKGGLKRAKSKKII